jgi:hypothetical protein
MTTSDDAQKKKEIEKIEKEIKDLEGSFQFYDLCKSYSGIHTANLYAELLV